MWMICLSPWGLMRTGSNSWSSYPTVTIDVSLVEPEIHVVMTHESDGAQSLRVVVGEHPLAVEGGRDRDAQPLGESDERCAGIGPRRPVTGQDDGVRCFIENGGGTGHLARRGLVGTGDVHRERAGLGRCRGALYVFGDRQIDRSRALGLRQLESLSDHLRRCFSRGNES